MTKFVQLIQKFFSWYFPFVREHLPSRSQKPCVGLDIGSRFCKAVQLARTKNGFKLVSWVIEPIEGVDATPSIRKTLEKLGFQSKDVYTAVSGQGTLIRLIKMPRMLLEQIRESLSLEADKYFPFPANEIYIDCQIIDDKRIKDNKIPVLVAAAKKSIVNDRLSLLAKLSLQTEVVGLNAAAVANAVEKFHEKENALAADKKAETFAILNMGESKTTIVIFRDNAARFTREIAIGGKHCTQRIAETLGCSPAEAEEIKRGNREDEAFAICKEILQNLASEIRLSLDYFSSEDSLQIKAPGEDLGPEDSSHVAKIFAIGDNASRLKARDFLSQQLEIPIELWMPRVNLEFDNEDAKKKFLENINRLTVALGLAVTEND